MKTSSAGWTRLPCPFKSPKEKNWSRGTVSTSWRFLLLSPSSSTSFSSSMSSKSSGEKNFYFYICKSAKLFAQVKAWVWKQLQPKPLGQDDEIGEGGEHSHIKKSSEAWPQPGQLLTLLTLSSDPLSPSGNLWPALYLAFWGCRLPVPMLVYAHLDFWIFQMTRTNLISKKS